VGALHAAQKAVARAPSDRDWWIRLSNWAREAHARSSSTSTQQYIEAARTAMQHARTLEASAPGSWVQRLDVELQPALETVGATVGAAMRHDGITAAPTIKAHRARRTARLG
jgi:hypothetical protein